MTGGAVVGFSMVVRTERRNIPNLIGTAFPQWNDMMRFEEHTSVRSAKADRTAPLTSSIRPQQRRHANLGASEVCLPGDRPSLGDCRLSFEQKLIDRR